MPLSPGHLIEGQLFWCGGARSYDKCFLEESTGGDIATDFRWKGLKSTKKAQKTSENKIVIAERGWRCDKLVLSHCKVKLIGQAEMKRWWEDWLAGGACEWHRNMCAWVSGLEFTHDYWWKITKNVLLFIPLGWCHDNHYGTFSRLLLAVPKLETRWCLDSQGAPNIFAVQLITWNMCITLSFRCDWMNLVCYSIRLSRTINTVSISDWFVLQCLCQSSHKCNCPHLSV